MKKNKLSFDDLPAVAGKILNILSDPDRNPDNTLPDVLKRLSAVEEKLGAIYAAVMPERATFDRSEVCRILKLRPAQVADLENSGKLLSHKDGRKTVYYEIDVLRLQSQRVRAELAASPEPEGKPPVPFNPDGKQPINIKMASAILGKSTAAIYQLTANNRIPFHKEGSRVYFFEEELSKWLATPRKRGRRKSI